MDGHRFDQLAKTFVAVGSRRSVIGGLLGVALGLSRISAARATHKTGHHCTPSDNHACGTCLDLQAVCGTKEDCCQDEVGLTSCQVVADVQPGKVCGGSEGSQCCRLDGGSCANTCECCGTRHCCNFQCVSDNCDGED